ncbi:hypothetical protein SASPL_156460 [Salvia splendens]|uniref:RRM domain-containing protein n=1 Tax=Salvia splendens TaxID=180675 RepID=A0A8X8VWL8_SALSN|nr:hypothetical protein SASPL_156460 [Salvia splendens]
MLEFGLSARFSGMSIVLFLDFQFIFAYDMRGVVAMALFRKAASLLGRTVGSRVSRETSVSNPSIFQAIRCMSSSKVFVGGLSYQTDDNSLREAFDKYGQVVEARVILDRETQRSRGFGFVTYTTAEEASAAIQALDQQVSGESQTSDDAQGYGGDSGSYASGAADSGLGGGGEGSYRDYDAPGNFADKRG